MTVWSDVFYHVDQKSIESQSGDEDDRGRGEQRRDWHKVTDERWRENLMASVTISSSCSWGIPVFRFQYLIINVFCFFVFEPGLILWWARPLFWFDYYSFSDNSQHVLSLNPRPAYPTVYGTSQLGCPIGTSNLAYLKQFIILHLPPHTHHPNPCWNSPLFVCFLSQ